MSFAMPPPSAITMLIDPRRLPPFAPANASTCSKRLVDSPPGKNSGLKSRPASPERPLRHIAPKRRKWSR